MVEPISSDHVVKKCTQCPAMVWVKPEDQTQMCFLCYKRDHGEQAALEQAPPFAHAFKNVKLQGIVERKRCTFCNNIIFHHEAKKLGKTVCEPLYLRGYTYHSNRWHIWGRPTVQTGG